MSETITVALRTRTGKSANKELRKQGMVPATVYGLNEAPVSVQIPAKTVARALATEAGMNTMLHLQREGSDVKRHVIFKDVQRDPVTRRLMHVDFMRVDPNHKVRVHVPIVLKGTAVGIKEGGLLDFIHREIEVECLPAFIPARIEVDIESMKVGDTLRLDQIKLDSHLTVLGDAHNVICSVHGSKAEEETTEAASAAAAAPAAEPEAAKKGKK